MKQSSLVKKHQTSSKKYSVSLTFAER